MLYEVIQPADPVPVGRPGAAVQLDIESRQFGHHHRVVEPAQKVLIVGGGAAAAVEQPRLQFKAHDIAIVREAVFAPPLAEQPCP